MRALAFVVYFFLLSALVGASGYVIVWLVANAPSPQTIVSIVLFIAVASAVIDGLRNRF
jgi:hypothetical protein